MRKISKVTGLLTLILIVMGVQVFAVPPCPSTPGESAVDTFGPQQDLEQAQLYEEQCGTGVPPGCIVTENTLTTIASVPPTYVNTCEYTNAESEPVPEFSSVGIILAIAIVAAGGIFLIKRGGQEAKDYKKKIP